MKKAAIIILAVFLLFTVASCEPSAYVLTEDTFFLVMSNIRVYPAQYEGKDITFESFTYRLTDVEGKDHYCCVRKCSAEFGCRCGKDTIIGFILDYDGDIPEPRNQSEDTVEKTWIHTTGKLVFTDGYEPTLISIYAADGVTVEKVPFFVYHARELSLVENYSDLNYYVTK